MPSSTSPRTRKRPKLGASNPTPQSQQPSSTSSASNSFLSMEPSSYFFPSREELPRLVAVILIAASVALACNFVVNFLNRQPKPFCDSNDVLDDYLPDSCEPCPQHGVCQEGKLECLHGYKRHGKLCMEDTYINEKAKKLSNLVETHVCEAYAQHLCDGTGTIWVHEDDMWTNLNEFKLKENYDLDKAVYALAKQRAMDNAGQILERRTNSLGTKELKCPELLMEHYKPVLCIIQQWIAKHASVLLSVCASLVGCTFLLFKFRRRRNLSTRAEELYNKVCDILEENALTARGINGGCEPWVVASRLRDHLLLPKERKDPLLWTKVEELVQGDSRLDRYPRVVKGEAKVVWEWQVEGSLSSSGKQKKGDESKLYSSGGMTSSSRQQSQTLKDGALISC